MPIVRVTARDWRSAEQKRRLAKAIDDAVREHFEAEEIFVIFDEVANENIAVQGRLLSDVPEAQSRAIRAADVKR